MDSTSKTAADVRKETIDKLNTAQRTLHETSLIAEATVESLAEQGKRPFLGCEFRWKDSCVRMNVYCWAQGTNFAELRINWKMLTTMLSERTGYCVECRQFVVGL
jgi:hypothetical protein